jgi:outer membrane protein TolC
MQKDLFCFNTNINAINQNAEIENITSKISDDAKIISLRESIRKNAEIRVENGTMSVSDLLDEMTAESVARQTLKIHEIELLQKKYDLKHTLGQ